MMFQVPQFIEIESKILGPLTLKQFLLLAGTVIAGFLLYFVLKTGFWIIMMIILLSIAAAIAFLKINGQPFLKFSANALAYLWRPKFYIWKKEQPKEELPELKLPESKAVTQKPRESALNMLFLKIQTGAESLTQRIKKPPAPPRPKEIKEKYETVRRLTGEREVAKRVDYR